MTQNCFYGGQGDGSLVPCRQQPGVYASDGRYVGYQYDSFNRLVEMKEYVGGKVLETGYHYDDQSNHSYKTGLFRGIFLNGQRQIAYSYDDMSRRDKRVVMTTVPFVTEYTYYDGATSGSTSTVVKTLKNGSTTWEYAYDAVGNITSIKENGTVVESYGYDALNQLTTVVRGADTYSYSYDASGNITAVTKNGGSYKSYSYGNSNWKDLLTAYNGTTITYDEIGNPLTYRDGFSFTWSNGRQLVMAAKGDNTYTYTYDASGLRTSKTVGNTTTQYYWLGDKLQAQRTGNDYLIFLYDESGVPYGLIHKYGSTEKKYYYEYNLQGDIIGIINDAGTRVVTYQYSAWGELLSISGSMATTIGAANPLRYRGYYYDSETGLYYLQSRYYDPVTGRFINADNYASTGQGIISNNMFAYCLNNPVNLSDNSGNWPEWATVVLGAVAAVAAVAATVVTLGAAAPAAMCTLAAVGMSIGVSSTVATAAATAAVVVTTTAAAAYAGDIAYSSVTGDSLLLDTVFQGNADAYNTGLEITSIATFGMLEAAAHSPGVCFVEGTPIQTATGVIPIQLVVAGDLVWAWDEETGEVALKEVVETYVNETDELIHVFVHGEEIVTTPSHPFYSPIKGWTDAVRLRVGDILVLLNGEYVVVEKVQQEILENPVLVYNFQVEGYHTYYVSNSGVLVHNSCNHTGRWNSEKRKHWKDEATTAIPGKDYGAYVATESNINRMSRGLAPIGWDGYSVQLHHWEGIANNFYNYSPVSRTLHILIHK